MTTISQLTPREVRQAIREQFVKLPPTVDANGWLPGETHMDDRSEYAAPGDVLEPVEPVDLGQPSAPVRPLPDQSQGYQGITAPRVLTPLERIRAQAAKHDH